MIDTFSFWAGLRGDAEKDSGHVQPLIDALAEITRRGCSVALRHHTRKGGGEDGEAIRGSNAIAGAVDAYAEIERIRDAPPTQRQIVVTSRWPAPPVLIYDWCRDQGLRHLADAADREIASALAWPDRLLEAIAGDELNLDDLEDRLGADRRKWAKTLANLIHAGRIERLGGGRRGDPFRHRIPSRDSVPVLGRKGTGLIDSVSVRRISTDGNKSNPTSEETVHGTERDGIA